LSAITFHRRLRRCSKCEYRPIAPYPSVPNFTFLSTVRQIVGLRLLPSAASGLCPLLGVSNFSLPDPSSRESKSPLQVYDRVFPFHSSPLFPLRGYLCIFALDRSLSIRPARVSCDIFLLALCTPNPLYDPSPSFQGCFRKKPLISHETVPFRILFAHLAFATEADSFPARPCSRSLSFPYTQRRVLLRTAYHPEFGSISPRCFCSLAREIIRLCFVSFVQRRQHHP